MPRKSLFRFLILLGFLALAPTLFAEQDLKVRFELGNRWLVLNLTSFSRLSAGQSLEDIARMAESEYGVRTLFVNPRQSSFDDPNEEYFVGQLRNVSAPALYFYPGVSVGENIRPFADEAIIVMDASAGISTLKHEIVHHIIQIAYGGETPRRYLVGEELSEVTKRLRELTVRHQEETAGQETLLEEILRLKVRKIELVLEGHFLHFQEELINDEIILRSDTNPGGSLRERAERIGKLDVLQKQITLSFDQWIELIDKWIADHHTNEKAIAELNRVRSQYEQTISKLENYIEKLQQQHPDATEAFQRVSILNGTALYADPWSAIETSNPSGGAVVMGLLVVLGGSALGCTGLLNLLGFL